MQPAEREAMRVDLILRGLTRAEQLLRTSIGRDLVALADRNGFEQLGYTGIGPYVVEVLGIAARHGQEIARVERELQKRPALRQAYDDGAVCYSAVRMIITGTPVNEDAWWAQAAVAMPIRELRQFIEHNRRCRAEAEGGQVAPVDGNEIADPDERARGRWISFHASPSLAARWYVGVELVRRMEGADISYGDCVESFLGEFLSGEGFDACRAAWANGSTERLEPPRPRLKKGSWENLDPHGDLEISAVGFARQRLSSEVPEVRLPDDLQPGPCDDVRDIDCRLRRAARHLGRSRGRLRVVLADFAARKMYMDLRLISFGIYVKERLSMSVSWAEALVRLNSKLERCPLLARAFDEGDLTQQQVQLLAGLVDSKIEKPWIEHASRTTVRYLEQDVEAAKRLRALDPRQFAETFGLPGPRAAASFDDRTSKPTNPQVLDHYRQRSQAARERLGLAPTDEAQTCASAAAAGTSGSAPTGSEAQTCAADSTAQAPRSAAAPAASEAQTCAADPTAEAPGSAAAPAASEAQTCAADPTAEAPGSAAAPAASEAQTCASAATRPIGGWRAPESFEQMLANLVEELEGSADHYATGTFAARLRFWLPEEMEEIWMDARGAVAELLGRPVCTEDCIEMLIDAFLAEWGRRSLDFIRQHPLIERDGWRCAVPTCRRRAPLHEHHLCFRSQGGGNEPSLRVAICETHHLRGIHQGWIRVTGFAPRRLLWAQGIDMSGRVHLVVDDRALVA